MRWLVVCVFSMLVGSCGYVPYNDLPVGRFQGTLFVMWVGEGSSTTGDGRFVFVPMPNDPLTFVRGRTDGTVREIRPQIMYTDGGSIPRPIQPFKGFSPWGYAPGYMVHDWLFQARHCLADGKAEGEELNVAGMPFLESAEIMGETIKTLIAENRVSPDDVAPNAISSAVAGPVSRSLWDKTGACPEPRISDEHRQQVEAALRSVRTARTLDRAMTRSMANAASIVSVLQFN